MAGRTRGAAAAVLAAAGAAWYSLLRRPLPKTRGWLELHGLEAQVRIGRDRLGVPHVQARSIADLCFGHGFCTGQDRLWQLEFLRRVARGTVAEFGGERGVPIDRLMRTLGLHRAAEAEVERMPASARSRLDAYAAGVNGAVETARARPLELQLLRIEPEPWTSADSLAIAKVLALGFSTNMEMELFRAALVRRVGPDTAARLEPDYPRGNPVVTQPGVPWSGDALALAGQIADVRAAVGLAAEPAGSNNWAVSGARSATGHPLLAGDPHVATTMPGLLYMVELSAPETELRGASIPGLPGVVIGQSHHVAWSFTNAMADVQDLFVERVRGDAEPVYEFEGEWRPVRVRAETIAVRGRSKPERIDVWETHHGPLVNRVLDADGAEPLALAWTALDAPHGAVIGIDAGLVESGEALVEVFRGYTFPCMNLVWADTRGDIGYKLVGLLPRRRGNCPDLPKPGWTGQYEWDGYVPFDELPEIRNPADGVIVTANNRIAPDDYPHHITSEYLDGFRAARIEELLAASERHSLDDFARIQTDLFSIPGRETAARLARLTPSSQREVRAIERLRSWDNRLDPETVAGTIYEAFTVHFARAVSEAIIGDVESAERWRSKSVLGLTPMTAAPWRFQARLLELWSEADPELIGGRSWDELALDSLRRALDELERRFGAEPDGWRWGRVHGVDFEHVLAEGDGPIARAIDLLLSRKLPAGGAQETVCQIGFVPHNGDYRGRWAPSFRLLADLADPSRSRWQQMTGQSGHPGSPHYDDLQPDWLAGRTNAVGQPAVETLVLTPA